MQLPVEFVQNCTPETFFVIVLKRHNSTTHRTTAASALKLCKKMMKSVASEDRAIDFEPYLGHGHSNRFIFSASACTLKCCRSSWVQHPFLQMALVTKSIAASKKLVVFWMLIWLCFSIALYAQPLKLVEHTLSLDAVLSKSQNEFSGLAQWKDQILLIPQNSPKNFLNKIYGIDTTAISKGIRCDSCPISFNKVYYFKGLQEFREKIAQVGDVYDGIEGAVVIGDDIYLCIETRTYTCYVVKGRLSSDQDSGFIVLGKDFAVNKPAYFANAGFESIAYYPQQKRITIFFERNRITSEYTAVSFSTTLENASYHFFKSPLLFRLTDVSCDAAASNAYLGIQHHYHKDAEEFAFYVGDQLDIARRQMSGHHPQQLSYTGIINIQESVDGIHFEPLGYIGYTSDNWEGILHYRSGILVITDAVSGEKTKLSYFELPRSPRTEKPKRTE